MYWLWLLLVTVNASEYYRTLLYGDGLSGFLTVSPLKDDEFVIGFDIKKQPKGVRWALHKSSAPYDMAVMTDNCKRVKKSPHLMRNLPLQPKTLHRDQILGNTIVLAKDNQILACATIILPDYPLHAAVFHTKLIEGTIHVVRIGNNTMRLLPDIRYLTKLEEEEPEMDIFTWAFVDSCEKPEEGKITDNSEIGVDARTTISVDFPATRSLKSLAIYQNRKMFDCSPVQQVEIRMVMALDNGIGQKNYYEPVHSISKPLLDKLHIRDDCMDLATEAIHTRFDEFYPSVNIFGPESVMLKSLVVGDLCAVLRPQFPRPAATATFFHPVIGRLTIVDTEEKVHLTGNLRHAFDETATRGTIKISDEYAKDTSCGGVNCTDCHVIEDAAVIVGVNGKTVTLTGSFSWFNIKDMKSVIVDLQWTTVCANLTYLPTGAISAHALFKRISPVSSPTVASIVALEYPANNYTEVLINKHQSFSNAVAHERPLDGSITSGPPCGEQTLGPVKPVFWTGRLRSILSGDLNDTSVPIGLNMVTGTYSVLGTSVLLSDGNEVYCGDFKLLMEETVAVAKFEEPYEGFIRLTQHGTDNWSYGIPTEIYYSLQRVNSSDPLTKEKLDWDVVSIDNGSCKTGIVFDPFHINGSCSLSNHALCALGEGSAKSTALSLGARRHGVVHELPLSGPYSVAGKTLRLKSKEKDSVVQCAPLKIFSEATFRWLMYSNNTLAQVQSEFAKKVGLDLFQVDVDFTRELYGKSCSIFRITVHDVDERLAEILDEFDVASKRFKDSESPVCGAGAKLVQQQQHSGGSAHFRHSLSVIMLIVVWLYQ